MPTTEEEVPQKSIPLALQSLFYKVCAAVHIFVSLSVLRCVSFFPFFHGVIIMFVRETYGSMCGLMFKPESACSVLVHWSNAGPENGANCCVAMGSQTLIEAA